MLDKLGINLRLSFLHWRNLGPRGTLSVWQCASLKEGQIGQSESTPLSLLIWLLPVFVIQGVLHPHPWILIFHTDVIFCE